MPDIDNVVYGPRRPYSAPLVANWDVTAACNAACVMCYSRSGRRNPGELTTDECIAAARQFVAMGVLHVAIVGGEPFLRPDLVPVLAELLRGRVSVSISTNGLHVPDDQLRALATMNLSRLCVSLHAADKVTHNSIMREDAFDSAVNLLQRARAMGVRTGITTCLMSINYAQVKSIIKLAEELGCTFHSTSLYVATGRGPIDLDLSVDKYREFFEFWRDERRRLAGRVELATHHETLYCLVDPDYGKNPFVIGCTAGWSTMRLTETGDVTPCNLMPLVAGNIRTQSMAEIWRSSPVMLGLRDRERLKGRCGRCEYRHVCGGCRSTALAYSGDVLAEDPRCWYSPTACQPDNKTPLEERL